MAVPAVRPSLFCFCSKSYDLRSLFDQRNAFTLADSRSIVNNQRSNEGFFGMLESTIVLSDENLSKESGA